ncbi:4'-phosphopantetheinyl transferase superfamily protein [Streptomyces venezuelae]|uniref:4'-phosphopantetheinyl transferase family protein n=1 Tax=Streptomyces venezuelae TaxID=54571 RepID=UPI0012391360|nr:4'-phosphopantetheinyl transferase superfamily protein [Streptomyces venezuelae]QES09269.1 4'-phosphopantetheinyl transferase superfamily protein [Streptomyces venezuelae]
MLSTLLPDGVACAEAFDDLAPAPLFPEEELLVAAARQGRRSEFGTARLCARRALTSLGLPAGPLLRGRRREPLWPSGAVGSITHCAGYRAAAVARDRDMLALGIDAEPNGPLPADVLPVVAFGAEREWLSGYAAAHPGVHWDRLLFSAKESVYKVWYPLMGSWLGFEDVTVAMAPPGPAGGRFRARIARSTAGSALPAELSGRWAARDGLLVSAVAVPAGSGAREAA